jgi:hypothetical protein
VWRKARVLFKAPSIIISFQFIYDHNAIHADLDTRHIQNLFINMANFLASIFGTELDKVNCSFYFVSFLLPHPSISYLATRSSRDRLVHRFASPPDSRNKQNVTNRD